MIRRTVLLRSLRRDSARPTWPARRPRHPAAQAEALLRDVAFVCQMTRVVRESMTDDVPPRRG